MKSLAALQHTSADYLGLMEDHLEGRRIRFRYFRPFTEQGVLPRMNTVGDGLALLGGGPWGSAGIRNVPTLVEEIELTYECLKLGLPIIGIGLGAQIGVFIVTIRSGEDPVLVCIDRRIVPFVDRTGCKREDKDRRQDSMP